MINAARIFIKVSEEQKAWSYLRLCYLVPSDHYSWSLFYTRVLPLPWQCSFGLLHEADRLRMDCPSCGKSTCFNCKSPVSKGFYKKPEQHVQSANLQLHHVSGSTESAGWWKSVTDYIIHLLTSCLPVLPLRCLLFWSCFIFYLDLYIRNWISGLQWAPQHEGLSCEKFREWQQLNSPEYQNSRLELLLSRNKIGLMLNT